PCTSTSFTASARNSGVYVVDFMISLPLTSLSNGSVRKTQVTSAIRALNITRIIVAHRPETIASANRIILMEHGEIAKEMTSYTFAPRRHERRL
ncbi:hypothetical protein, partial [Duganella lactea]|uniref:hypothetical protein n=1 Tax=Duganella lactea TaxID=2692173 RepID=UPI001E2DA2E9